MPVIEKDRVLHTRSEIAIIRPSLKDNKAIMEAKAFIAAAREKKRHIPSLEEARNVRHDITHDPTFPIHELNHDYLMLINAVITAAKKLVTLKEICEFYNDVWKHVKIL